MGMFKKTVCVSNIYDRSRNFRRDFWVDTGALYSFVPEDELEKIGVAPTGKRNLILADGRTDTRLFGSCSFEIDGIEGAVPCPVIFAPKGSLWLLGATALENFGVSADPVHKDLKPILAIIGGFIASHHLESATSADRDREEKVGRKNAEDNSTQRRKGT